MRLKPQLKKTLLISAVSIIILIALSIAFISPLTKYLLEKYDEKYTGRNMRMDWAYVNPVTGYIHFSNYRIYEPQSDSVFFSAAGISINFSLLKIFSGIYEISALTLTNPRSNIIQNKTAFNFDDLLERFTPEEEKTSPEPIHFNLLNIKITNGEFLYTEQSIPVKYDIKKIEFSSPGMHWNTDTVNGNFSFAPADISGEVKGDFTLNIKNMDYRSGISVGKLDLKILEQYLLDFSNYGTLTALMDATIDATGNLNDKLQLNAEGKIVINDFHFGKNEEEDYVSFEKLLLTFDEFNPSAKRRILDSVIITRPFFKYERYDSLDNVQRMFGEKGANIQQVKEDTAKFNLVIEIAEYVREMSKNFLKDYYKINKLEIEQAEINFNDYSLREKFGVALVPLSIMADSIDKNRSKVNVFCNTGIIPYGNVSVTLELHPKNENDFDLSYKMQNIAAAMFNPYTVTHSSFPLDKGTIEVDGKWIVRNGIIDSDNHLLVIDPRTAKKIRKKDTKWLPVPLALAFIREQGNVIDYEIPVKGDMNNPEFKLKDVFLDLLENIFIKPPTTSYRLQVKNAEQKIEKFLTVKWEIGKSELGRQEENFVKKMAEFFEKNPEASVSVYPMEFMEKEKEFILFFEAKKKYFLSTHHKKPGDFNRDDSTFVDKISVKDESFIRYLDKRVKDTMLFTVQGKCKALISDDAVIAEYNRLANQRVKTFKGFFNENEVGGRIKILKSKNHIPYNGFSFFKIEYHGEIPRAFMDAYEELNELNEEEFRKKYREKRKITGTKNEIALHQK